MKILGVVFLLSITQSFAQETKTLGTLIQINFNDHSVDTTRTIGTWESGSTNNYYSYQYFEKVFTYNNIIYLIKHYDNQPNGFFYPPSFSKSLFNTVTKSERIICSSWYPECGTGSYLTTDFKITTLNEGFGFTVNYPRANFIFSADSLYSLNSSNNSPWVVHIAGRVGNKFLVVAGKVGSSYEYYLEDLIRNQSPKFNEQITFQNSQSAFGMAPIRITCLTDSLFLMSFEWNSNLYISKLSSDRFTKIDSLEIISKFWTLKKNKLFYFDEQYLVTRDFDKTVMKFKEKKNFIKTGLKMCFDYTGNYFATIDSDTLKIFSLKNESLINKLYLTNISKYGSILIDSPYVYIHKTEKVTGVEDDVILPDKFELNQNYPNPFNPLTTIRFSIPKSQFIILKVFDILGKEIATLVNEEKQPGTYKVEFNTETLGRSFLPSGVYFYTLQTDLFSVTKKMILLK